MSKSKQQKQQKQSYPLPSGKYTDSLKEFTYAWDMIKAPFEARGIDVTGFSPGLSLGVRNNIDIETVYKLFPQTELWEFDFPKKWQNSDSVLDEMQRHYHSSALTSRDNTVGMAGMLVGLHIGHAGASTSHRDAELMRTMDHIAFVLDEHWPLHIRSGAELFFATLISLAETVRQQALLVASAPEQFNIDVARQSTRMLRLDAITTCGLKRCIARYLHGMLCSGFGGKYVGCKYAGGWSNSVSSSTCMTSPRTFIAKYSGATDVSVLLKYYVNDVCKLFGLQKQTWYSTASFTVIADHIINNTKFLKDL